MSKNKCLDAVTRRAGGRFIDVDDVLLALLNDPECRDRRRWPEVFGQVRIAPPHNDVGSFIGRAIREQVDQIRLAPQLAGAGSFIANAIREQVALLPPEP